MQLENTTNHDLGVAAAVEQLRQAMINADEAELGRLASESLTYGHSNGNIETKVQFVETIISRKSIFESIKLTDAYIKAEGDVAIARHTFLALISDGGKSNNIKLHILLVWRLEGGEWKLLARQAARLQ